jgi:hypothetical protein
MKNQKTLPEEKLLQLIKEGRNQSRQNPAGPFAALSPDIVINQNAHPLQLHFSFFHLKICAAVLCGFAAVVLLKNLVLPLEFRDTPRRVSGYGASEKTPAAEPVETLDSYLADVSAQSFFRLQSPDVPGGAAGAELVQNDLTKDLSLMGIISGENPQAVIEDKKGQQTLYLTKGQFISDMRVADIQENKVILEYRGKRVELHL